MMINFIVKLEDILRNSGNDDWEIRYYPSDNFYVLELDGDRICMFNLDEKENNND